MMAFGARLLIENKQYTSGPSRPPHENFFEGEQELVLCILIEGAPYTHPKPGLVSSQRTPPNEGPSSGTTA